MRYSRIGVGRYRKSLRSRSVGAAVLVAVLAATLLTTLVVGASAANRKTNHGNRAHRAHTTARPMKLQDNNPNGGGTLPTHGVGKPPLPFTG